MILTKITQSHLAVRRYISPSSKQMKIKSIDTLLKRKLIEYSRAHLDQFLHNHNSYHMILPLFIYIQCLLWKYVTHTFFVCMPQFFGKRSELWKSERQKPTRASEKLQSIRTWKIFKKVIRTSKLTKIRTSKVVDHFIKNQNV